ncbi:PaaI family thioesterase [Sphingosinicella rhizophila]|uniref:PaaI family thioesterase n=1 Tax=Sphingosinicella rhizophila TaxID=3050082 RepID=A0ABU3Q3L2_9SPHN|nr:PaaI family thioesterase [Sphingosinicella sp. GR2756]MDT9597553.1 PaaI family thioesterase [Sphingosinicella sp. GR2756]
MSPIDPRTSKNFDPRLFFSYARELGHGGALGIDYVAHGPDWVELGLDYDERLIGVVATGIIASGPIISLMDMATSMAIWVKINRFRPQATLDLRIDYLRPAVPGRKIVGRGECYRITTHVGFVRGLAHDGDRNDPVAHVSGTFMFTDAG